MERSEDTPQQRDLLSAARSITQYLLRPLLSKTIVEYGHPISATTYEGLGLHRQFEKYRIDSNGKKQLVEQGWQRRRKIGPIQWWETTRE